MILIYIVCKGRVYPGSAGQGLRPIADVVHTRQGEKVIIIYGQLHITHEFMK